MFNSFESNISFGSHQQRVNNKSNGRLVIRRLPPNFTIDEFKFHFYPLPPHEHFYLLCNKGCSAFSHFSRAYVTFVNVNDIFNFQNKYDGLSITGRNGVVYTAVVELASFQPNWISHRINKLDSQVGTILKDKYFLNFEENDKSKKCTVQSCFGYNIKDNSKLGTTVATPLLKFLKEKHDKKQRACREDFYFKTYKQKCM